MDVLAEAESALRASREAPCCVPGEGDSPEGPASPIPAVYVDYGLSLLDLDAHHDPIEQGEGGVRGEQWDAMLQRFRAGLGSVLEEPAPGASSPSAASPAVKGTVRLHVRQEKSELRLTRR